MFDVVIKALEHRVVTTHQRPIFSSQSPKLFSGPALRSPDPIARFKRGKWPPEKENERTKMEGE